MTYRSNDERTLLQAFLAFLVAKKWLNPDESDEAKKLVETFVAKRDVNKSKAQPKAKEPDRPAPESGITKK